MAKMTDAEFKTYHAQLERNAAQRLQMRPRESANDHYPGHGM